MTAPSVIPSEVEESPMRNGVAACSFGTDSRASLTMRSLDTIMNFKLKIWRQRDREVPRQTRQLRSPRHFA